MRYFLVFISFLKKVLTSKKTWAYLLVWGGLIVTAQQMIPDMLMKFQKNVYNLHLEEVASIEEHKILFDEVVRDFIGSDAYIKEEGHNNFPEEMRFATYKEIRSNPYLARWTTDNYHASQYRKSDIVEEMKAIFHLQILSPKDQERKNKRLFYNFLDAFFNRKKIKTIPHIHHRLWITDSDCPTEIPDRILDLYQKALATFPKDWKHIFWCIDPNKIPETVKKLEPVLMEFDN